MNSIKCDFFLMQEINPERQESPGSGEGDELIKTDNDEVSPLVFNSVVTVHCVQYPER
jgi:hypothetical protein